MPALVVNLKPVCYQFNHDGRLLYTQFACFEFPEKELVRSLRSAARCWFGNAKVLVLRNVKPTDRTTPMQATTTLPTDGPVALPAAVTPADCESAVITEQDRAALVRLICAINEHLLFGHRPSQLDATVYNFTEIDNQLGTLRPPILQHLINHYTAAGWVVDHRTYPSA